jgi:hypothetical protein
LIGHLGGLELPRHRDRPDAATDCRGMCEQGLYGVLTDHRDAFVGIGGQRDEVLAERIESVRDLGPRQRAVVVDQCDPVGVGHRPISDSVEHRLFSFKRSTSGPIVRFTGHQVK